MDQVEEIKRKTDIVTLIGERVKLVKAGRNFKAPCPFHSERTPSFMVSPELGIYKCFGCFPAGELVKTPFGLHQIQDVVDGEYVISGKGQIKKVLATHERDYGGDVVAVRLSKLTEPVTLTADHMVLTVGGSPTYSKRYKYLSKRLHFYRKYSREKRLTKIWHYFPIEEVAAGELRKGMTLLYPIDTTVRDVEAIDLRQYITKKWPPHGTKPFVPPFEIQVNEYFLKLLGYYIAEGSNHRAYIRFSLGNHEEAFANEIVSLIRKIFGLNASVHKRGNSGKTGIEVACCNSILANVFENLCGKHAENKHIPFVFQQLPRVKQRILLESIFKGDGHESIQNKSVHVSRWISTTSKVLAEQLRDILLRLGYFPAVYIDDEKKDKLGVHHKRAYRLYWMVDQKLSKFRHIYENEEGNKFWLLPISSVKKRRFKGKVYNLTVEGDHSYVANTFAVANCGKAGDAYSFLEEYEGMEFPEALSYLANKAGVKLKPFRPSRDYQRKEKLWEINHYASEFYHFILGSHKAGSKGLRYLKERGIHKRSIEAFKLGFAPDSWDSLTRYLTGKKRYKLEELIEVGLVVHGRKQAYDRFRNRVIFTLRDTRGNVVGFAGRVLPGYEGKGGKYINSPETELYHKSEHLYGLYENRSAIKGEDQVVVVEGELDAISSWQAGVKNVVAVKGTALTENQVEILRRYTRNVLLALDADVAGDAATKRGISLADSASLNINVVPLMGRKDPDAIAQSNPKQWKNLVSKSISIYSFFIKSAKKRHDVSKGLGKKRISEELIPVLALISNAVEQAHYIKKLAKVLDVSEETVMDEIKRYERVKSLGTVSEKIAREEEQTAEEKGRNQVLEEYLLSLLLQGGKSALSLLEKGLVADITHPAIKRIVGELVEVDKRSFQAGLFISSLPAELGKVGQVAFLRELGDLISDSDLLQAEFKRVALELRKLALGKKLDKISSKISELEAKDKVSEKEEQKLERLRERFSKLSRKLSI